jgi:alpha-mannosidase
MQRLSVRVISVVAVPWLTAAAWGQEQAASPTLAPASATARPLDLTKDPTLYMVGYAHLDTQWRWSYPQVIR